MQNLCRTCATYTNVWTKSLIRRHTLGYTLWCEHPFTGIWFVYYYIVFQAALCFLSSRAVPTAIFDKRVFYLLKTGFVSVSCERYNQTVTEKFEQCSKVTDNTVMVVMFTVDVNNEIMQMKYLLKRDHVCTRMKLGLVQSPAYNIDTVYFMDWGF